MSKINVQRNELSINERNSITGNQSVHNLTGPRARFQPVRIKALLDQFESDDDDTEPRDSEDDSDAESLQALPNDDDDDDNDAYKDRKDPKDHGTSEGEEVLSSIPENKEALLLNAENNRAADQIAISLNNVAIEEKISLAKETANHNMPQVPLDNKIDETREARLSRNSNSFELQRMVLPMSQRKAILSVIPKHCLNDNVNAVANSVETIISNPQISIDAMKRRTVLLPEKTFETHQQNLGSVLRIESGDRCTATATQLPLGGCANMEKAKEQSHQQLLIHSAMKTPSKHAPAVTGHSKTYAVHRNIFETPQAKTHNNEYSQNSVETPGMIFSHWSHNNFLKTPTQYQNQVSQNKEGTAGQQYHPTPNLRLPPNRFHLANSNNKMVRRPLTEAMHFNQGTSTNEMQNNHVVDHQSLSRASSCLPKDLESLYNVQSDLLAKENCPTKIKQNARGNFADKIMHSLSENHNPQSSTSSASLNNEEKMNPQISWKGENGLVSNIISTVNEQLNYGSILNKNYSSVAKPNSTEFTAGQEVGEKLQTTSHNSAEKLRLRNNECKGSSLGKTDGLKIKLPSSVDRSKPSVLKDAKSDPGNPVQFSIASKPPDKKYGKIITVKGSDYLVLGKLGQGMSGEVLRVQDTKSGDLRAIKCVDLSRIEKETAQGCLEEVSMLDRLRAPCIINMFTYEIKSHLLYVVMEMGDTDLSKLLKSMSREKQLPLTMILYYWTEMLTAVKHIHDNGVIHSDLKPANFLLVRGRLKLIDFGIASTVNADMTSVVKNTSLGTLNYISPEAIIDIGGNGDSSSDDNKYKINFKSDVWSLGCILYSLVYGQTPFQHIRADWAKVTAITNPNQKIAFPPSESMSRRGYTSPPPFLVDVMRRCLQHDRRARPTVEQLLQIPYIGCNCPSASSLPTISPSILSKIKQSLEENEWRQLLEALERRKPLQ